MIKSLNDLKKMPGRRPDYLYKYRSLANEMTKRNTSDIFNNNRFFHCATKNFNDPFEATFFFKLNHYDLDVTKFIAAWKHFSNFTDEDIQYLITLAKRAHQQSSNESLEQKFKELVQERTTVLSLCENYDNILMWSHYGDSHQGICIEFDVNASLGYWEMVLPIQYLKLYPYVLNAEIGIKELSAIYLSKSMQWSYEKEWRFINNLKKPGLQAFPEESISAIIIGCNISNENYELVKQWAKNRKKKPLIAKTFLDSNSYTLGIIR